LRPDGVIAMKDRNLTPIPLDNLKVGTLAQSDVYSHNSGQLLIKSGTLLDERILERVKSLNENKPMVFLSGLPLSALAMPAEEMETRRKALEKETGYDTVNNEAFDFLNQVATSKTIEMINLKKVSTQLGNQLGVRSPSIVLSLVNALAPVDEYLQRHCINTALINGLMGKWMGLSAEKTNRLALIGLLHDCGKALTPASILNETRRLTTAEFEIIKTHPLRSYELLSNFPEDVRLAARCHHEKADGSGYPDGLPLEKIPIESRVTTISDIYDALVAQRAYKEPRSPFSTMALLKKLAGTELDPELVDVFVRNMPKELIGKQVVLSNGSIAYIREIDTEDIEYPIVIQYGQAIKTHEALCCKSMY